MSDTNEMNDSQRGAGTNAPSRWLRGLDLCVSSLGYSLGGSILALPWALYWGAEPIWFREGQFVVAMTFLVVGVLLIRPKRRTHHHVTEADRTREGDERGDRGVKSGNGGVDSSGRKVDSGNGGVDISGRKGDISGRKGDISGRKGDSSGRKGDSSGRKGDNEAATEDRRSVTDEGTSERSHPPRHHRLLADFLDRPPLAPSERVARGWRLLLASALLMALSLGVEVVGA